MPVVEFSIPDGVWGVVDWFEKELQTLANAQYRDGPGVTLVLGQPRRVNPRAKGIITDIVMPALWVKATAIPSDWAPEYLVAGWKHEEKPIEPLMRFRFASLDDATYVLASCDDHLSQVRDDFLRFLGRVQVRYPSVGPAWQELAAQEREHKRQAMMAEFIAAGAGAGAAAPGDGGPATASGGAQVEPQPPLPVAAEAKDTGLEDEAPDPARQTDAAKQRRGPYRDQRKKLRAMWETREAGVRAPFSVAWQDQALTYETVTAWIPKRIAQDWQTRKRFTWAEFTELWPEHLRDDYED